MAKIIIDIFMYLFELLLLLYYSNSLFEAKKSNSKRVSLMLISFAFLGVIYQLNITYLNIILMFIIYTILLLYLYKVSFKTAVFHSLIFTAVMLASEILVMALSSALYKGFNTFESSLSAYLVIISTSKLLYFSLMLIILKIFAKKENNEQYNKYFWLLFIMPLTSIMVLTCFRYISYQMHLTRTMSILWIISCIGLLFANILVFIIYEYSLKNTKELYELKEIQQREEQEKRYFELNSTYMNLLQSQNDELQMVFHDTKHHYTALRGMESVDEVREYISKIYPELESKNSIAFSKNRMLDLILNKYVTVCKNNGIKLNIEVKTASLDYIDDAELSVLINNILDNAVEAAVKSTEKQIDFSLRNINDMDLLSVINSCDNPPEYDSNKLITSKFDAHNHGFGTRIISRHAQKNNGKYEWFYDEKEHKFHLTILFQKQ